MATRRMRIKAVINVPRGGAKTESQEIVPSSPAPTTPLSVTDNSPLNNVPLSPAPVPSPRICSGPVSPAPGHGAPLSPAPDPTPPPPLDIPLSTPTSPFLPSRAGTPPIAERMPSSPKSPASWQLQRPSPSKSPAALPPSGSILRRSPSPAFINTARSTSSPGPPPAILSLLSSPVKSPVPNYSSSFQKANVPSPPENPKFITRTPVIIMPSSLSLGSRPCDNYPTSSSPGLEISLKSPPSYFRPPPSPSTYQESFHSVKSPPGVISRPSPAQSPVFGVPGIRTSSSFLSQHLNSNSNSADSHEVAALMSNSSNVPFSPTGSLYPPSPDKLQRYSVSGRGSENSYPAVGAGAFSIVSSNKAICSPSFSQSVLDNPEAMKRRMEERKKDTIPNPTKFSQARKEFFEKIVTGQVPERAKMTMLHYTFYNPPKPDGTGGTTKAGSKKSRSRASSMCSESDSRHDINLDSDKGKALSAPSSIASRRTTASSMGSGGSVVSITGQDDAQSEAGSTASNGSNVPGPRVKVGPDGQLIIDEKSLVVETSESQRARKQIEDMEVVSGANYAVGSSGFYRFKRNYRRGHDWTEKETIRFYRALNQCGTDFSMMLSLFPNRTRQELKSKFKREDRKNPDMVSKALASCHFDPDEGISSDEELALYYGKSKDGKLTEKEKLLQEEAEMEEVICSSEDATANGAKRKKKKEKPKTVAFTKEQLKEMQATSDNVSGPGTSKGKLWNSRVIGLPPKGKLTKLPPIGMAGGEGTTQLLTHIKSEVQSQVVLKSAKKKSTKKVMLPTVSDSGGVEATVPIFISEGVIGPLVDIATVKKEKADSTIPKTEKREQNQTSADLQAPVGNAKRRARLPKTKPNVKAVKGGDKKRQSGGKDMGQSEVVNVVANESNNSSQGSVSTAPMCVDLFRFDASDPLGFKVVPTPLPIVQETELQGDEEGADGLVIVDLDELNSMTAAAEDDSRPQSSGSTNNSRKRKKSASSNTDGIPVTTTRILGDPYGKSVMTMASIKRDSDKDVGTSSTVGAAPNKKVKVLPYRVPGPGGILPACQSSLATELEIEIELNSAPSSES